MIQKTFVINTVFKHLVAMLQMQQLLFIRHSFIIVYTIESNQFMPYQLLELCRIKSDMVKLNEAGG
jgi:hypothetical protein